MTDVTAPPTTQAPTIPIDDIAPYAIFFALIAVLLFYFVGAEEGATSIFPGMTLHEWVHDGRHLLGFPCH
jgi:putative cobalt transporter subunit CbtB